MAMDKERKGASKQGDADPAGAKAKADSGPAGTRSPGDRARGSWVREDGAICFDNECISLKPEKDGQLAITYDPTKCSCEDSNDAVLKALAECVISGKGINLIVKPRNVESPK